MSEVPPALTTHASLNLAIDALMAAPSEDREPLRLLLLDAVCAIACSYYSLGIEHGLAFGTLKDNPLP